MAYNDILTLTLVGLLSGSLVGLLSIGGGIIIVPVLHILYPNIAMQDIVIISLHQIFISSLITFLTHKGKQNSRKINYVWLVLHFLCLILAAIIIHLIKPKVISYLFMFFIILSLITRIALKFKCSVYKFNFYNEFMTTLCAFYGSLVGLGGSILLYPLLRISNVTYTKALKDCAFSSFTVGLMGVITHDLLYLLNINHYFPWIMMMIIVLTSALTARITSLKTYQLKQKIIDNLSFILSIIVIIVYYYFL